jgi:phage gp29-like protein
MSIFKKISNATRETIGNVGARLVQFSRVPIAVPGAGLAPPAYELPRDANQQRIIDSKDALYGRTTYYTGPVPNYISTNPKSFLTPERVKSIHDQVLIAGWMLDKACLDEEIMLSDSHLAAIDESRRDASVGKPFSIKPPNGSDLARKIADYQMAVINDTHGFPDMSKRLLYANPAGYALEEIAYKNKKIVFPIGKDKLASVEGPHPDSFAWLTNKATRFDLNTDELLIDMGASAFVTLPPHKFIYHRASGDFQVRRRGYLYKAVWLHMFKNAALARWQVVLDIWGIPVPYGIAQEDLWQDQERKNQMFAMLQDFGLGKPAVFTSDFEIKASATISQGDSKGMHAAITGFVNTEYSKLIQGETLTTEIGAVGSYGAATSHEGTKHDRIVKDAKGISDTLRHYLLRPMLELNMESLCKILGASPFEILLNNGIPHFRIEREVSTKDRMSLYVSATNDLGLTIDQDQIYEEFGFERARTPDKAAPGKAQLLSGDALAISNADAIEGVDNPKEDAVDPTSSSVSDSSNPSSNEISQTP